MTSLAQYERWKSERQRSRVGAANVTLTDAQTYNPDQFAGDVRLGKAFGVTPGIAAEGRDRLADKLQARRNETILGASPLLTQWLGNPENARTSWDDIDNLSWFEGFARGLGRTAQRADARIATVVEQSRLERYATRAADQDRSFSEVLESERERVTVNDEEIALWPKLGDILSAGYRYSAAQLAEALGADDEQAAIDQAKVVDEAYERLASIPKSTIATEFEQQAFSGEGEGFVDTLGNVATAAAGNPVGALSWALEVAGESAPQLAAGAAVTVATRRPALGLGATWAGSYTSERYLSPLEFFAEKGLDLGNDEDVRRLLSDPELLREAAERGVIRGAIVASFETLGAGIAGRPIVSNPAVDAFAQGITQAITGATGEYVARKSAGQEVDFNEVLAEGFAEIATLPVDMGIAGRQYVRNRRAAGKAETGVTQLEQISVSASGSKVRERLDTKFMDWVDRAVDGSPVSDVYVPATAMQEYFQTARVDPADFLSEIPGTSLTDFEVALSTGGDVKIPTGTYAAKLAGTEFDPFLRENMRFDPEAMTLREAQEFNEQAQEALEEAYQEAERLRSEDEQLRSFEQEIYETMVSRLRMAGRSTDVATNEAMLYPAFYRTMAERSGMTAEELLQMFPLPEVRGSRPEGLEPKNVDEFTRTLAELRNRKPFRDRRRSLLEFISDRGGINDTGGELESRNAAKVKRGNRNLRLRRRTTDRVMDFLGGSSGSETGFGFDDVARAAIEAGYLQNNQIANEYRVAQEEGREVPDIGRALLEAIDEELRGDLQYAEDPDDAVERSAFLDQLEDYLGQLGVSLDDPDEDIRAAIEADQAERVGEAPLLFQELRGSVQFPETGVGQATITLFETANLSTFIHETGHDFLRITQALASQDSAPAGVVEMYDTIKTWWGQNAADVAADAKKATGVDVTAQDVEKALSDGSTGDSAKDSAIDVGMQEQFARASEAYFMEGKAPSQELRSAFERFRAWLLNIYKRIAGLNVNVTPEIRSVLDRMLATDREIEDARVSVADEMLFQSAAEAGISEEDYRSLAKLHDQARDEAKQRLLRDTMKPIQREREEWFRKERAKVREEVAESVNREKVYRALEWLGNRRWLGDGAPEGIPDMRMAKAALVERYGEGVLKTLPRGKFTVYAVEDGMDPDEVAGWFGFASGDELVKELEKAPPRKEKIEAETDRMMRERHGDVLKDGSVEEAALEAIHGDKRGQYLAAELDALNRRAGRGGQKTTAQAAREIARRTLGRMQVRDAINSRRYLAAERRAADEAMRASARGEYDVAAEAARKRLINHSLYAESVKIADEVERAERYVSRLNKKSTRDNLAGDYLEAIDEIMARYDFRKVSGRQEARKGALLAYVERMKAEGRENELAIPDYIIADARRTPYKRLPVDELRGVIDSLKNIEHTARFKKKLIDAKSQRDLDEVVGDFLDAFDKNVKKRPPSRARSGRKTGREYATQYLNLVRNADTILREIDGFDDFGAVYRNVKAPIDAATNELTVMRRKAAEDFEQLYSVYTQAERRNMGRLMDVPELGGQYSKWDIISLAFNIGNEGNYQRLTDHRVPGSFAPEQIEAVLTRLDGRDADFVQSVWDLIDSYWPEIEAREKRVSGVAPEKVPPRPVTIAGKQLRGGYFPLKYDAELSSLARDDSERDVTDSIQAGRFGKAQTRNGHLKERASSSGRPVLIDIGVLHGHVNQVVHDLAMSEAVNNSWRILQDGRVKGAFLGAGRKADFDTLEIWLQDVAAGEMRSADVFNKMARRARAGFTVSKLAFNVSTVLVQGTGISQSMVVVGKKNFVKGATDLFRYSPNPWTSINRASAEVMAVSPFMRERQSTFNKDIYDILGDTRSGPSENRVSRFAREVLAPLGFWLMTKAQFYVVDLPTWFAAHRKAMDAGATEQEAVAQADRAVARSQASGVFSDRSAIERGSINRTTRQSDVVRLFTALGSYMFAKFNVAYERTAQTEFRDPRSALIWATDMAMLFAVEGVLYAAIKGRLPDDEDDEDGDGTADEWAQFLAAETAFSALSTLPIVRDMASAVQGYGGGGAYASVIETISSPLLQASQGEMDRAFVRSLVDVAGFTLMLPSTQANRLWEAAYRQWQGEDVSPLEYLVGKTD